MHPIRIQYSLKASEAGKLRFSAVDLDANVDWEVVGSLPLNDSRTAVSVRAAGAAQWIPLETVKVGQESGEIAEFGRIPVGSIYETGLELEARAFGGTVYDLKLYVEDLAGNGFEWISEAAIDVGTSPW